VEWKPLQDVILSLNTGLNPRQFFKLNTDDATNYYVTIREIHNHRIVFNEKTDRLNDEALKLCNNRSNLEVGDVLFSGTGTIGETALIEEYPTNWNIKEGVYTIKPNQKLIIPKYLLYILDTSETKARYMKKASGGTVKSVPMVEMRKLVLPIPPIEKQKYSPIQIGGISNPIEIATKIKRAALSLSLKSSKILCPTPNITRSITPKIIHKLTDIKNLLYNYYVKKIYFLFIGF
jgi:restriction endonuclease S subunit